METRLGLIVDLEHLLRRPAGQLVKEVRSELVITWVKVACRFFRSWELVHTHHLFKPDQRERITVRASRSQLCVAPMFANRLPFPVSTFDSFSFVRNWRKLDCAGKVGRGVVVA